MSLYPFINFCTAYPVGRPDEIITPADPIINWTKSGDCLYQGLLKVRIIPPPKGQLRLPVIPTKVDTRLIFGYCTKCARAFKNKPTKIHHICEHSDLERSYTTTLTSLELMKALDNGYRADRLYRVWQFDKLDDNLFKPYVRQFLKLKVEASGWPPEVQNEEQKKAFIDEYHQRFGVKIDEANVDLNPGMRFIAKICLNSLWYGLLCEKSL